MVPGSFSVEPSTAQAGAHADLSVSVEFAHDESGNTFNDLRSTVFELPAGMSGNPQATPTCTQTDFLSGAIYPSCPPGSQVGTVELTGHIAVGEFHTKLSLYNLVPAEPGLPAEFGFRYALLGQRIPLTLRDDGGLNIEARDIAANIEARKATIDVWGVPAAEAHDPERGIYCFSYDPNEPNCLGGSQVAGVPPRAFLTNPTRCGSATVELRGVSWQEPQAVARATAEAGPIVGCDALAFEPHLQVAATSADAESPTGFSLALELPGDWTDPSARAPSALRSARIALPDGISLNPGLVDGYEACSPAMLARETATSAPGEGCPRASVVGSVEALTPSLGEPVRGSLYLAEPFDNPTGARIAFYVLAKAPSGGVIKFLAALKVDPRSGRLSVVVEQAPQIPLTLLRLSLGSAGSGPLITPAGCGISTAAVELTPWSAPEDARRLEAAVRVDRGAGGAPCQPPASRPFSPAFSVASVRSQAGASSPLRLRVSRKDGELQLGRVSFRLPRGLTAALADVQACPEATLEAARGRSGAAERRTPSCPESSLLGRTAIEVGAGASPAALAGHAYLAGPVAGSPLSVALVTPALLGPFDFGTVVVREALRLDPRTGAVVLDSGDDRLPAAIDGTPLHLRGLTIDLDRPGLVRNPTGCGNLRATAVAEGYGDGVTRAVDLDSPYRATGCHRLRFAPRLRLALLGTSARNGHPGLRLMLASHPDEANLASASVGLPAGMLLDPSRLGATCGTVKAAARACPAASVVGWARAVSPLLAEPLRGQVILRTNPRTQLPDLAVELRGKTIDLTIMARPRLTRSGLEIVTKSLPDVPISKFMVVLAGGRDGLLVHSRGFCGDDDGFEVAIAAQNGKKRSWNARLRKQCRPRDGGRGRPAR